MERCGQCQNWLRTGLWGKRPCFSFLGHLSYGGENPKRSSEQAWGVVGGRRKKTEIELPIGDAE